MNFRNERINIATKKDILRIVELLNMGYRGEKSRKGWTTEADLISGEIRSNEDDVRGVMEEEGSVFLVYTHDGGEVSGCMNLKKQSRRIYLGMFAVEPELQARGIGGELMKAAEEYANYQDCSSIYMYVISVRDELISWYKRKGFEDTGERVPFHENFTGKHVRPLEFAILEKNI